MANDVVFVAPTLNTQVNELVTEFLRTEGGSRVKSTYREKKRDLERFELFLADNVRAKPLLCDVTKTAIETFRDYRLEQESPATVQRRLATIKTFCRFSHNTIKDFRDPSLYVKHPVVIRDLIETYTEEEISAMLKVSKYGKSNGVALRNQLVMFILIHSGFRISTIREMLMGNVDLKGMWFHGLWCKNNRYAPFPIHSATKAVFEQYLRAREVEILRTDKEFSTYDAKQKMRYPVFISTRGAIPGDPNSYKLNPKTLWRIVKDIADRAGVKNAYPHKFRHTFGTRIINATNNLPGVSRLLNHANLKDTMKYLHSQPDQLRELIESF